MTSSYHLEPWEHPDWYDLHDTTWTAGPDREPEHYRELVISLPPLDYEDHLVDVGAGTGKIARAIARAYPRLGRVSLVEPNERKIERAVERVREALPNAEIRAFPIAVGHDSSLSDLDASVVTAGSVFMPTMELWTGSLASANEWLRAAFEQVARLMRRDGAFFDLETLAAPWVRGNLDGPSRRLRMSELTEELFRKFTSVECAYRFRDRVILKASGPRP
ncbi:MAG: class I SAM-dependent methyltransferase [Vicinamibacteria bacterium]